MPETPETPETPEPRGDPREDPRTRARTPLLELLTRQALDEDYAYVARRRSATSEQAGRASGNRTSRRPGLAGAAVVACFGALVAVAFVQTSRTADVADAGRSALLDRIDGRRELVARQQRELTDLRTTITQREGELQDAVADEQAARAVESRLAARTGFVAVSGPGVRVVVDDAPDADDDALVRDSDLALLVDALWSAGAEAISINGQRVTAAGGIRNSGDPIEVNSIGIAPPYTVQVVGDPLTLEARFFDTSSGLAFDSLQQTYGFSYDFTTAERLRLPAAPARLRSLDYAEPTGRAGSPGEGSGS